MERFILRPVWVTSAEPQVNTRTGVIVLRMQFPSTDKLLLPGTYVKVDVQTDLMDGLFLVDQNTVNREVVQWISDGGSTVFKG